MICRMHGTRQFILLPVLFALTCRVGGAHRREPGLPPGSVISEKPEEIVTEIEYQTRGRRTCLVRQPGSGALAVVVRAPTGKVLQACEPTEVHRQILTSLCAIHLVRELTRRDARRAMSHQRPDRLTIRWSSEGYEDSDAWDVIPRLGESGPVILRYVPSSRVLGYAEEVDIPKSVIIALRNGCAKPE